MAIKDQIFKTLQHNYKVINVCQLQTSTIDIYELKANLNNKKIIDCPLIEIMLYKYKKLKV